MDLYYKALIFIIFAIPAILSIGLAECIKNMSWVGKIILYGFGVICSILAFVVPWLK